MVLIFCIIVSVALTPDWPVENQPSTKKVETKIDPVEERLNEIRELYKDEPTFEKAEKIENNAIWIYFTDIPDLWVDDPVDFLARWQARNLSNIVNGVATAKIFVAWEWQMFCVATKWQVNECKDYR